MLLHSRCMLLHMCSGQSRAGAGQGRLRYGCFKCRMGGRRGNDRRAKGTSPQELQHACFATYACCLATRAGRRRRAGDLQRSLGGPLPILPRLISLSATLSPFIRSKRGNAGTQAVCRHVWAPLCQACAYNVEKLGYHRRVQLSNRVPHLQQQQQRQDPSGTHTGGTCLSGGSGGRADVAW